MRDGGAKNRHEAVAEKLIDDAVVLVDDVNHEVEQRIQIGHHRCRWSVSREVAEVTNIQEHYADVAQFAGQFDRLSRQLLGDLRRDVLTEDANRAIALQYRV